MPTLRRSGRAAEVIAMSQQRPRLSFAMINLIRLAQSGANRPADYRVPDLTDFGPAVAKLRTSKKIQGETQRLTLKKSHPRSRKLVVT